MSLAEMGIDRKRVANARAIASLPEDVFEAALHEPKKKLSERALVNLAKGRAEGFRYGRPLTEALRAAQCLSREDRHALGVALYTPDEAAEIYAALTRVSR
jgi:hypothetical protein